jgi:chromosome segregation ATPase
MYLKELQISGFKSFAKKSTLELLDDKVEQQ